MHVIFLVHGMGSSTPGWSKSARDILRKHYKPEKYAFLADFAFDAHFAFEEVNYNNIFDRYLVEAGKQADKLGRWSKLVDPANQVLNGLLGRVVAAASTPPSKGFLVTHIADVAFFMATDLGEHVKSAVASQIAARLAKGKFDPAKDSWSVIAHSLGTRVMTETLQVGFSAAPGFLSVGKARVLLMAANVSRLLQEIVPPVFNAGDVYRNLVYPSNGPLGVCRHFINATHRLDPFAFIKEFDPPATFGDGNALADGLYHPVKLATSDITDKDVHALEHYLEHPAVHSTLFRYLLPGTGRKQATRQEMEQAMAEYHQATLAAQVTNAWRARLQALKDEQFQKLEEVLGIWEKYGDLLA